MKQLKRIAFVLLPLVCAPASDAAGMFSEGQSYFMLEGGSGTAFNHNYLILGAGVNYFVRDGWSVGLAYSNWSGNSPAINQFAPSVQYVFYDVPRVKPYLGGFYRHSFISGQSSLNSFGVRAGAFLYAGRQTAFGVGLAGENYMNCQPAFGACSQVYPEISLIVRY